MSKSAKMSILVWIGLTLHWTLTFTSRTYSENPYYILFSVVIVGAALGNLLLMKKPWWRKVPSDD